MAPCEIETAHLRLDELGRVWTNGPLTTEPDAQAVFEVIGYVAEDLDWPKWLGPEPTWYLTELGELVDRFEDACRFSLGCREAAECGYRNGIGA